MKVNSLNPRRFASGMPKVKDFDEVLVFADPVVDKNRTVRKLSHTGALSHDAAHARKANQQLDVIEKGIAEARATSGSSSAT